MSKPRAPSDPSPSTGTEHNQPFALPTSVPRDLRSAEPFITISASMLLGLDVSHSGWVRKEGFGFRSCKFLVFLLLKG